MFRFLMTILLMIACFFAGKLSALEIPDFEVIYEQPAAQISSQEILALARNQEFKTEFPELYHQFMVLLAAPQLQNELSNPNRANSAIYQRFNELVTFIAMQLNAIITQNRV